MGFGEAVSLFFKNYVNFNGRSRRAEFWWPALMNLIVVGVLGVVGFILAGGPEAFEGGQPALPGIALFGLLGIYYLAIILPSISLMIRRLHDINMTGWIYLGLVLANFIPVLNFISSIAVIVIGCIPGTAGTNKYGPDPKNPEGEVLETFE